VVSRQIEDIANTLHIKDIAMATMATIFAFLYMGCTLVPSGEYDSTIRVWGRCGLMTNYFHDLFYSGYDLQKNISFFSYCCTAANTFYWFTIIFNIL